MHTEVERELRPELNAGEKLLGVDSRAVACACALPTPCSSPSASFGVASLSSGSSVIRGGAPLFFTLWGVPFVLMGLHLIAGRFVVDAWQRARTYYGVTTERVLIASGLFQRQVKSLSLRGLPEITITERRDRSGTITFGIIPAMYGWLAGSSWPGLGKQLPPSFEMIENVRQVYGQVQSAQRALQPVGA
jgi:hypothetical protein